MLMLQIKRIISSEKWFNYVITFFFFWKMPKNLTTLNGEKKRIALWALKTIHVIYVISGEYTFSQFFPTFDMDKYGKLCQHHWKKCLKIIKTANFESDLLKTIQTCVNFCKLQSYIFAR